MFFYFILMFILFILIAYLKSPHFKGKVGEMQVSADVNNNLGEEYILLNNCTLPDQEQGTTQIDHILISPYGIFIIETKNYTGWIFGNARQNSGHRKFIKKAISFKILCIRNINIAKCWKWF